MAEKDFEKDVIIGKVYKGKGGESQHGPWQIWNFYLKDPDDKRKFTWFEKDGLIPIEGMSIKAMEFEIEVKGEYTNHTVKWFKHNPTPNTPNTPQKSTQSAPVSTGGTISTMERVSMSFLVTPVKDMIIQAMMNSQDYGLRTIEDLTIILSQCCTNLYNKLNENVQEVVEIPKAEPEPYKPKLGPDDDYPPIGEPPPE